MNNNENSKLYNEKDICSECKHFDICKWTSEMINVKNNAAKLVMESEVSPIVVGVSCRKFEKHSNIKNTYAKPFSELQRDFDYRRMYVNN